MYFKWENLYQEYFKENFPKNEGIYDYLSEEQEEVLKQYFRWRTKTVFNRLCSYQNLRISEKKAKDLISIIGSARDWQYDGVIDLGSMHGHCTLGHSLRYEHHAYSPSTGKDIIFGVKCASDFFDVSKDVLKRIDKVREETFEDIKRILYVKYNNLALEYINLYTSDFPQPFLKQPNANAMLQQYLGDEGMLILYNIIVAKLPIPPDFIDSINRFKKLYVDKQDELKFMGILNEQQIKTLKDVQDNNTPYHDYFICKVIRNFMYYKTYNETPKEVIQLIDLCSLVIKNYQLVEKIYDYINFDNIFQYSTVYFIVDGNKKRPAYLDEIQSKASKAKREYLCYLEASIWDKIMSLVYMKHGGIKAIRACLPKARTRNYKMSLIETNLDVIPIVISGLEILNSIDLLEEIDKFKIYKNDVLAINNTKSPSRLNPELEETEIVTEKMEKEAWNYLKSHKSEITYKLLLEFLNRYDDVSKLSDKQLKVVMDIYKKMTKDTSNDKVESSKLSIEPQRKLRNTNEVERLLIIADSNGKRCSLIALNDSCKVINARKYIANNISDMLDVYTQLEDGSVVVCNNKEALNILEQIKDLYKNTSSNNENAKVIRTKTMSLSDVIGNADFEISELGFTETKMRVFTRTVFKEEGCIDNFLQDSTAKFLKYRKVIKENSIH